MRSLWVADRAAATSWAVRAPHADKAAILHVAQAAVLAAASRPDNGTVLVSAAAAAAALGHVPAFVLLVDR